MNRKSLLIGFIVGLVFMLLPAPVLLIPDSAALENFIHIVIHTIGLIAVVVIGIKLLLSAFRELRG